MSIFGAIVTFIVVWWIVLFVVLPFGIQSQVEAQNSANIKIIKGTDTGAPFSPNLKFKFLMATLIATFIWGSFFLLFYYNIISIDAFIR